MTPSEMRDRIAVIDRERDRLTAERYALILALEIAERRLDSYEARFARAFIAHDSAALDALCAESRAAYRREYGCWPEQEIEDAAARIVAAGENEP